MEGVEGVGVREGRPGGVGVTDTGKDKEERGGRERGRERGIEGAESAREPAVLETHSYRHTPTCALPRSRTPLTGPTAALND